MGNRAVITTKCEDAKNSKNLGLYLHWNGGHDSVRAFLAYCELKGFEPPETNSYAWARLNKIIENFNFEGLNMKLSPTDNAMQVELKQIMMRGYLASKEHSIIVDTCDKLHCEHLDNGVYLIENWEITGRQYFNGEEQKKHDLLQMLFDINKAQPADERLSDDVIKDYVEKINNIKS